MPQYYGTVMHALSDFSVFEAVMSQWKYKHRPQNSNMNNEYLRIYAFAFIGISQVPHTFAMVSP
jgi:hypothetical protein